MVQCSTYDIGMEREVKAFDSHPPLEIQQSRGVLLEGCRAQGVRMSPLRSRMVSYEQRRRLLFYCYGVVQEKVRFVKTMRDEDKLKVKRVHSTKAEKSCDNL